MNNELEETPEIEEELPVVEGVEPKTTEGDEPKPEDGEETFISFGDEDDDDSAPDLPKRLRNEIKERDRELAILRRERDEAQAQATPEPIEVGEKPTLEGSEYDEEAYEKALEEYYGRVRAADEQSKQPGVDDEIKQGVEEKLTSYEASKSSLPFADAAEITQQTANALSPQAHFNIVSATKDPATFIYALGKNPAKLKALADIKNPAEQIAEAARMEIGMKVGRTKAPAPDKGLQGNKSAAVGVDKEEARLEKQADETGDRTELIKYRKAKKAA